MYLWTSFQFILVLSSNIYREKIVSWHQEDSSSDHFIERIHDDHHDGPFGVDRAGFELGVDLMMSTAPQNILIWVSWSKESFSFRCKTAESFNQRKCWKPNHGLFRRAISGYNSLSGWDFKTSIWPVPALNQRATRRPNYGPFQLYFWKIGNLTSPLNGWPRDSLNVEICK